MFDTAMISYGLYPCACLLSLSTLPWLKLARTMLYSHVFLSFFCFPWKHVGITLDMSAKVFHHLICPCRINFQVDFPMKLSGGMTFVTSNFDVQMRKICWQWWWKNCNHLIARWPYVFQSTSWCFWDLQICRWSDGQRKQLTIKCLDFGRQPWAKYGGNAVRQFEGLARHPAASHLEFTTEQLTSGIVYPVGRAFHICWFLEGNTRVNGYGLWQFFPSIDEHLTLFYVIFIDFPSRLPLIVRFVKRWLVEPPRHGPNWDWLRWWKTWSWQSSLGGRYFWTQK